MSSYRNTSTGDVVDAADLPKGEEARLQSMPERWEKVADDPDKRDPMPPVPGSVAPSDRQVAGKALDDRAGDTDPEPLPGRDQHAGPADVDPGQVGNRGEATDEDAAPTATTVTTSTSTRSTGKSTGSKKS